MEELDQELDELMRRRLARTQADKVWKAATRAWLDERRQHGLKARQSAKQAKPIVQVPQDDSDAHRASQEAA